MNVVLAVLVGLGLAAACGFRVFVPLLVLAVASRLGQVGVAPSLGWIGSTEAIVALATATVVEIAAYKIPWLDHVLDVFASPAAIVAGTIAAASQIGLVFPHGTDGPVTWGPALIAGGGIAALVQSATVGTRAVSTATTLGLANPILSFGQSIVSVAMSVVAIVAPFAVLGVLLVVLAIGWRCASRRGLTRPRTNRTLV